MTKPTKEGIAAVAEMLAHMSGAERAKLLKNVAERDPALAVAVEEQIFGFEDIAGLDDRSLQALIKEIPQQTLVLALRKASDELKEALFRNMSLRTRTQLVEDLESQPAQRLSEVTAAQGKLVVVAKKLGAEGKFG